ncbi:MAG TPA: bacteriohemerythrin [Rhodocyclaceae bacterium]
MAAMMEWNDSLKVGHGMIDRDHQRLVALINQLGEAMSAGQGKEACGAVLDELIDYTRTHFANEERLMAAHGYPDSAAHRAEHARLIEDVQEFRIKYASGTATLSVFLLRFLMEWLTHHIMQSDKKLAQALPPG